MFCKGINKILVAIVCAFPATGTATKHAFLRLQFSLHNTAAPGNNKKNSLTFQCLRTTCKFLNVDL